MITGRLPAQQGEPLVVQDLTFRGNRYIDDYRLRVSIATSRSSFWERTPGFNQLPFGEKRYFDETELRRDVVRILLLYRRSGFYDAEVDTVVQRAETTVRIQFVIQEGDPIVVDSVWVTGAERVMPRRELLRDLPLQVGDPFDRLLYLASSDTIRARLRNRGHPFVRVFHHLEEDRPRGIVTAGFTVVPGPLASIGSIRVVGPQTVDDGVVRRMLTIRPGQVYSERRMVESQRELYRLGVFEYVDITLADTVPTGDSLVTIQARVSEGRLNDVQAGVGFGTLDCFRTRTGWTVRDFLGGGRTLDLSARFSKLGVTSPAQFAPSGICREIERDIDERRVVNYNVGASLRFPYVLSPRNSAALTLSAERRSEINAYVRTAQGGSVSFTHQPRFNVPVTLSYSLARGRTLADDVTLCERFNLCSDLDQQELRAFQIQSTIGVNVSRDRTNNALNPTRGTRLSVDASFSSSAIGSNEFAQFFKWVTEGSWYRPVGRGAVLAARLRMGVIWPPNLMNIGAAQVQVVPTHERFYLGGPNTVRGFRQNELGPVVYVEAPVEGPMDTLVVDTIVSPTGDNQMFLANVELRLRVPGFANRVGAAVFIDAGDVFDRTTARGPFKRLRITPGAGLRFATPLGPIRVDLAYNPYDPDDPNDPFDDPSGYTAIGDRLIRLVPFNLPPPTGVWSRLRFNFSIGEAF